MYILSGENITAVYTMSRRQWGQNTTQVITGQTGPGATYVRLLHIPQYQFVYSGPCIDKQSWSLYFVIGQWAGFLSTPTKEF